MWRLGSKVKDHENYEVKVRTEILVGQLLEVWGSSVKVTHLFLSDGEIGNIKTYVPQALNTVPVLVIAKDEIGKPVGFMGFEVYKRMALDRPGNPYPLLYMRRR